MQTVNLLFRTMSILYRMVKLNEVCCFGHVSYFGTCAFAVRNSFVASQPVRKCDFEYTCIDYSRRFDTLRRLVENRK